jgi:hypothetical protein
MGVTTQIAGWLALASTVVTISVTALNTAWSRDAAKKAQGLNEDIARRKQDLKIAQHALEANKDRMSRFDFVQSLTPQLLSREIAQKTVAINLISLSLTPDEAAAFFKGLELSKSPELANAGELAGDSTLDLLIAQLDNKDRVVRGAAVDSLTQRYTETPVAIEKALAMLEGSQLDALQPEGRINLLVFLKRTSPAAWSLKTTDRGRKAIENIRARSKAGIAAAGPQTLQHLSALEAFLKVSVEEILIALRDDRHLLQQPLVLERGYMSALAAANSGSGARTTLYPSGFTGARFVDVIESGAVWHDR